MNANLAPIREALATAREDLHDALPKLRKLLAWEAPGLRELFARIEGDIHEIELLHKRELSLLESGHDPEPQPEACA